jgi:hypothetical protein
MTLDDEAQRCALIVALYDWRDAERVYSEQAAKYTGAWWLGDVPLHEEDSEQPVTQEALDMLDREGQAADAARAAYYALAV